MKSALKISLSVIALSVATSAQAAPKDAVCAVEQIISCEAFLPCERSLPGGVNMPALIKIEHGNGVVLSRTAAGGDRTSTIAMTEELEGGYTMLGVDEGNGWSFRLTDETGRFTFATAHNGVSYTGFGVCASE